jgi:hypothetical protein
MRYVEFPERKVAIGSKYPVFRLGYTQALGGVMSSDVAYSKWNLTVSDGLNLKLAGNFNYQLLLGGFLNRDRLQTPDFIHLRGAATRLTAGFSNTFQLVPVYYFSHASKFYTAAYTEHHFNGFITNKIPGFRKLKWNLVGGANALYIKPDRYYLEPFIGLENIFRLLRVDYVYGIETGGKTRSAIRFGLQRSLFGN